MMRPQPLICVGDVEASSRWYQRLLNCQSAHGGPNYERLVFAGKLVLQLHGWEVDRVARSILEHRRITYIQHVIVRERHHTEPRLGISVQIVGGPAASSDRTRPRPWSIAT